MADAAAANGAAGGQQQRGGGQNILGTILRMAFMWYLMNWFKGGNQGASKNPADMSYPKFGRADLFDMYAFVSESRDPASVVGSEPIWVEHAVQFATAAPRHSN